MYWVFVLQKKKEFFGNKNHEEESIANYRHEFLKKYYAFFEGNTPMGALD